ncbi:MAG: IS5 family transposase [Planctomycetota bacterium]|nr:IS5 family transposase [Planctomycetota bacterium]
MGKVRYKVGNWREYNRALKNRYNLNLWISPDVVVGWLAAPEGRRWRGRPRIYSDAAITLCMMLRVLFRLPLRGCEGFVRSLFVMVGISVDRIPDYTTICRRGRELEVDLPSARRGGAVDVAFDSSGLKVCGEGEWKVRVHGKSRRRGWRKIHIGVDVESGEIVAVEVTREGEHDSRVGRRMVEDIVRSGRRLRNGYADGSYDTRKMREAIAEAGGRAVIPPRRNAKIWKRHGGAGPPDSRDEDLRYIRKFGRRRWREAMGYGKRNLAESWVSRYKRVIGEDMMSRGKENQCVEVRIGAAILNRMAMLGMPDSYAVKVV